MESVQNLLQQLAGMQWSDYLDIAVVAFLIYKLLPLLRTPSTMRVARAVAVVEPLDIVLTPVVRDILLRVLLVAPV